MFKCCHPEGLRFLTTLNSNLAFQDKLNPICRYRIDIETIIHYLLNCPSYSNERLIHLIKLSSVDGEILKSNNSQISLILLLGKSSSNIEENMSLLKATIEFILAAKLFDDKLI